MRSGQFRAVPGAQPAVGSVGELEHVEEDKVEITLINRKGTGEAVKEALNELKTVSCFASVDFMIHQVAFERCTLTKRLPMMFIGSKTSKIINQKA